MLAQIENGHFRSVFKEGGDYIDMKFKARFSLAKVQLALEPCFNVRARATIDWLWADENGILKCDIPFHFVVYQPGVTSKYEKLGVHAWETVDAVKMKTRSIIEDIFGVRPVLAGMKVHYKGEQLDWRHIAWEALANYDGGFVHIHVSFDNRFVSVLFDNRFGDTSIAVTPNEGDASEAADTDGADAFSDGSYTVISP